LTDFWFSLITVVLINLSVVPHMIIWKLFC